MLQFFKEHFKGAILAKFGLSNTRVYYICARFIAECQLDCLLLISRCKTKHIDYVSNVQYHMLKVCVHKTYNEMIIVNTFSKNHDFDSLKKNFRTKI